MPFPEYRLSQKEYMVSEASEMHTGEIPENSTPPLTGIPIGVRLFNRPDHAESLLKSLLRQTRQIQPSQVTAVIDAYEGSRDQQLGRPDKTKEVRQVLLHAFPGCHIIDYPKNVGLARANFDLQKSVFSKPNSDWAVFIEEDITLDPTFLETISMLIARCDTYDDIVKISTDHISLNYLWHKLDHNRLPLYLGQGTKAIAERKTYFEQRASLTEIYLETISGRAYSNRDEANVFITLAQHGIFTVMGNNDVVHDRMLMRFGKLHVSGNMNMALDDGVTGETDFVHPDFPHIPFTRLSASDISEQALAETLEAIRDDVYRFERRFFRDIWNAYLVSTSGVRSIQVLLGKLSKTLRKLLPRRFR